MRRIIIAAALALGLAPLAGAQALTVTPPASGTGVEATQVQYYYPPPRPYYRPPPPPRWHHYHRPAWHHPRPYYRPPPPPRHWGHHHHHGRRHWR